jgi:uncharacterized protein YqgV (UPF0045/DUF77 family)
MSRLRQVNAALQVLPRVKEGHPYDVVDKAIELISSSGLRYKVCPFETVVEGPLQDILNLAGNVVDVCHTAGADDLMMYIKIQSSCTTDVCIEDKMKKYEQSGS